MKEMKRNERNERNDDWYRVSRFFCKNGVKNTPQKHWFLGILLAGTKNISYLCIMKTQSERENENRGKRRFGERAGR
jgi:hypothetical protein